MNRFIIITDLYGSDPWVAAVIETTFRKAADVALDIVERSDMCCGLLRV